MSTDLREWRGADTVSVLGAAAQPVPVVFLAGLGRSGSTLLERLLDALPGWFSLGEVVHLWKRGVVDDELCGCGERFSVCPVWTAIGDAAYGGWDQLDVDEVLRLQRHVERDRFIPLLLRPGLSADFVERLARYEGVLLRLYCAAQEVTGATVVVDASKHVSSVLGLRHNQGVELHPVQLTRDSRGVAYSWTKPVRRPATGDRTLMAQWSPFETACRYLGYNAALAIAFRSQRLRLRYEDLVTRPHGIVADIQQWVGHGEALRLADDGSRTVELGLGHGISGNPMRSRTGTIELTVDDEWRRSLPRRARLLVTAITWPSLLRWGYDLSFSDRPGSERPTRAPLSRASGEGYGAAPGDELSGPDRAATVRS